VIDLHTHILPGLDDGADDLDESLRMLQIAADDGVSTMVATPHYQCANPIAIQEIGRAVTALVQSVMERALPVSLCGGAEVMLTPDLAEVGEALRSLTLNQSRYMLVELPVQFRPLYSDYVIDFLQSRGVRVILAHAERYEWIQRDLDQAKQFVAKDVLLQVNSGSVTGDAGPTTQRCARDLVVRGLVSFLASDAHSARRRVPGLASARQTVTGLIGSEAADALVNANPDAVLANDPDLPPSPPYSRSRVLRFLPASWLGVAAPLFAGRRPS
jgi:protein-tyrosine phosphatase